MIALLEPGDLCRICCDVQWHSHSHSQFIQICPCGCRVLSIFFVIHYGIKHRTLAEYNGMPGIYPCLPEHHNVIRGNVDLVKAFVFLPRPSASLCGLLLTREDPRIACGWLWEDLVTRKCPSCSYQLLYVRALVWCVPCLPGCRQVLFGETLGVLWCSGLVCTVSARLSTGSVRGDSGRALVLWSGVYCVCPAVDRFCSGRLWACSGALVWCVLCLSGCRQVLFGETLGVLWWSGVYRVCPAVDRFCSGRLWACSGALVCTVSARLSTGSVRGDSGRALVVRAGAGGVRAGSDPRRLCPARAEAAQTQMMAVPVRGGGRADPPRTAARHKDPPVAAAATAAAAWGQRQATG